MPLLPLFFKIIPLLYDNCKGFKWETTERFYIDTTQSSLALISSLSVLTFKGFCKNYCQFPSHTPQYLHWPKDSKLLLSVEVSSFSCSSSTHNPMWELNWKNLCYIYIFLVLFWHFSAFIQHFSLSLNARLFLAVFWQYFRTNKEQRKNDRDDH